MAGAAGWPPDVGIRQERLSLESNETFKTTSSSGAIGEGGDGHVPSQPEDPSGSDVEVRGASDAPNAETDKRSSVPVVEDLFDDDQEEPGAGGGMGSPEGNERVHRDLEVIFFRERATGNTGQPGVQEDAAPPPWNTTGGAQGASAETGTGADRPAEPASPTPAVNLMTLLGGGGSAGEEGGAAAARKSTNPFADDSDESATAVHPAEDASQQTSAINSELASFMEPAALEGEKAAGQQESAINSELAAMLDPSVKPPEPEEERGGVEQLEDIMEAAPDKSTAESKNPFFADLEGEAGDTVEEPRELPPGMLVDAPAPEGRPQEPSSEMYEVDLSGETPSVPSPGGKGGKAQEYPLETDNEKAQALAQSMILQGMAAMEKEHYEEAAGLLMQGRDVLKQIGEAVAQKLAKQAANEDRFHPFRAAQKQREETHDLSLRIAQISLEIGNVLLLLSRHQEAMFEFQTALSLRRLHLGPSRMECGRVMDRMGVVLRGMGQYREAMEKHDAAIKILEEELNKKRVICGDEAQQWYHDAAECMTHVGNVFWSMGRFKRALDSYREAYDLREMQLTEKHNMGLAATMMGIANTLFSMGRYKESLSIHEKSLKTKIKALGTRKHSTVAASLLNIGAVLVVQGRLQEALARYDEALAIEVEIYGGSKTMGVADTLCNFASVLYSLERYNEALGRYKEALSITQKALGKQHSMVGRILVGIANVLAAQKKYDKALSTYRRARKIQEDELGQEHVDVASTLMGIAHVLFSLAQFEDALFEYETALMIKRKGLGPKHVDVALGIFSIANVLHSMGLTTQARSRVEEVIEMAYADPSLLDLGPMKWACEFFDFSFCCVCRIRMDRLYNGPETCKSYDTPNIDDIGHSMCCICGSKSRFCSPCQSRMKLPRYSMKSLFFNKGCNTCGKFKSEHHFGPQWCDPPIGTKPLSPTGALKASKGYQRVDMEDREEVVARKPLMNERQAAESIQHVRPGRPAESFSSESEEEDEAESSSPEPIRTTSVKGGIRVVRGDTEEACKFQKLPPPPPANRHAAQAYAAESAAGPAPLSKSASVKFVLANTSPSDEDGSTAVGAANNSGGLMSLRVDADDSLGSGFWLGGGNRGGVWGDAKATDDCVDEGASLLNSNTKDAWDDDFDEEDGEAAEPLTQWKEREDPDKGSAYQ